LANSGKFLVVVPTYAEEENIDPLLTGIFTHCHDVHVLFVDDNSPDGTRDRVRGWMQRRPAQVFLLEREEKNGLGRAYIAGFGWALARDYAFICEMDADLSHRPVDLANVLAHTSAAPVIVGSRYVEGGGTQNWGLGRKLISKAGSLYAGTILRMSVRDMTGGFNCWRRDVLETIDLATIKSEGYSFQIELKYRAHLAGFPILEQPILFEERRAGESKMSSRIIVEAMLRVWTLATKRSYLPGKPKACLHS
jgi:dolichol-phosphate mannosyltransferase